MRKGLYLLMSLLMLFPISSYALDEVTDGESISVKTEIVTLEKCVDGDTANFKISDSEVVKARFLAIDTPETVHPTKGEEAFGKDASNYTCTTLTNAKEIKFEYDSNSNEEDNYGRKLVWVFVDGVLLQDLLVSQGYAEVAYLYGNYKYTSLLQDSQEVAKLNKVGIWSVEESETTSSNEEYANKKVEKKEKEKGFFDELLGMISDFIDELLEKILKMIEDML